MQLRWSRFGWLLLAFASLMSLGCGHSISSAVRQQAVPPIPFRDLRANPDTYTGRTVILGGDIIKTRNTENQTFVEVLQKPLDHFGSPHLTDQTEGRFMAQCDRYLDPAIYAKERQVTIAGRVLGRHTGQVGEAEYIYPLVTCIETHLWPQATAHSYYDDPYFDYPFYPWYRPWYHHPFYHHHLHPFHYSHRSHRSHRGRHRR